MINNGRNLTPVRAVVVRGGTSRALCLNLNDLPATREEREQLCLELIGSPDPAAIDGLGGGISSNSKVMFIGRAEQHRTTYPSVPAECELISVFAQVTPDKAEVDWSGNCGNISAATGTFAFHSGLLPSAPSVRVWNANTRASFELVHHGQLPHQEVEVRFLNPGGEKTGAIFPHGPRTTLASGLEVSLVDIANPIVLIRASDLSYGVDKQSNSEPAILEYLEGIRRQAAQVLGLEGAVLPRLAIISPGKASLACPLPVLMTSVGRIHHALPATGILAIAGALALGGTIAEDYVEPREEVTLSHPKGQVRVRAQRKGAALEWISLQRSARIILDGSYYPNIA